MRKIMASYGRLHILVRNEQDNAKKSRNICTTRLKKTKQKNIEVFKEKKRKEKNISNSLKGKLVITKENEECLKSEVKKERKYMT